MKAHPAFYAIELPAGYRWEGRRVIAEPPRAGRWQDVFRNVRTRRKARDIARHCGPGTVVRVYRHDKRTNNYWRRDEWGWELRNEPTRFRKRGNP